MRKPSFAIILAASLVLGFVSPWLAGHTVNYLDPSARHGLLYVWFYSLPIVVDQIFWIENGLAMLALIVGVYAAQYLALFA